MQPRPIVPGDDTPEGAVVGLGRSLMMAQPQPPEGLLNVPGVGDVLVEAPAGTVVAPVTGACLAPLLKSPDCCIGHGGMIRRGDVVMFRVAGDPMGFRGKVYVGELGPSPVSRALYGDHAGPFMLFHQFSPACWILIPLADLEGALVVWGRIRDGACEEFPPQPGLSHLAEHAEVLSVCEPRAFEPIVPGDL